MQKNKTYTKTQKIHTNILPFTNSANLKQKRSILKNKSALNRLILSFGNINLNFN